MAYPTLAQTKVYMAVVGITHDATITQLLAASVAAVEKHTNRVFVEATLTETFRVRFPFITNNGLILHLFKDLVSVTTLTNGEGTVIAATDYDLYPKIPYYQIQLRRGKGIYFQSDGEDTPITVLGKWGYSVDVPDDVFAEIMRITDLSFRARAEGAGIRVTRTGNIIDKGQWPPSTLSVLEAYIR